MGAPDVPKSSDVYYQDNYWNNLDCTVEMINSRISGDGDVNWWRHFAERSQRVFERALILNCGNGWVEREMIEAGFIKQAVGVDYSSDLLQRAQEAAGSMPILYEQVDINTDPLPQDEFDLVVNHAAAHHITRIDRVFRAICDLLPAHGWFISFDYIGPHRNQWSPDAWDALWKANRRLPANMRQSLWYPHLPTMLHTDPTEAVHSELILATVRRYFDIDEFVPVGGAVAYPLLTFNSGLFSLADVDERDRWARIVLDIDAEYLSAHPDSSLFAYFTAQPNKATLRDEEQLERWQRQEDEREAQARSNGGGREYFERTALHDLYEALEQLQLENEDLRHQLDAIRDSYLYSHLTRIQAMPVVQRLRTTRLARSVLGRLKGQ